MRPRPILLALLTPLILCAAASPARAEPSSLEADRADYMRSRLGLMTALTAWGGLNLVGGAVLWATAPSEPKRREAWRSFAAMAAAYGLVNGVLGVNTLARMESTRAELSSFGAVTQNRIDSSDLFAVNVGIDMLSVGVGAAIWANSASPRAQGAGASVMAQGIFLVGFDAFGSVIYRY